MDRNTPTAMMLYFDSLNLINKAAHRLSEDQYREFHKALLDYIKKLSNQEK